ncbi:MAG TPA: hypothetical protein VGC79_25035 [Polyangiaceae bacterium]
MASADHATAKDRRQAGSALYGSELAAGSGGLRRACAWTPFGRDLALGCA